MHLGLVIIGVGCAGCQTAPKAPQPCDACAITAAMGPDEPEISFEPPVQSELQKADDEGGKWDSEDAVTIHTASFPMDSDEQELPQPVVASDPVVDAEERRSDPEANEDVGPPHVIGTHLGVVPMTATEHALKLKEENVRLQASRDSLQGDNERLKAQLAETRGLMERMVAAMAAARQALDSAEKNNQRLKQTVIDLQQQLKRDRLSAQRTLDAIRDELDDVLMREISWKDR